MYLAVEEWLPINTGCSTKQNKTRLLCNSSGNRFTQSLEVIFVDKCKTFMSHILQLHNQKKVREFSDMHYWGHTVPVLHLWRILRTKYILKEYCFHTLHLQEAATHVFSLKVLAERDLSFFSPSSLLWDDHRHTTPIITGQSLPNPWIGPLLHLTSTYFIKDPILPGDSAWQKRLINWLFGK